MASVKKCSMIQCVFNNNNHCGTLAICVGSSTLCETYLRGNHKVSTLEATIGVCKASSCIHNDSYECKLADVSIETHATAALCKSFSSK